MTRAETEKDAEKLLRSQGLSYLTGTWRYYDLDDHDWFPCVIQEAYEHKIIVNRTNEMGYLDPDDFKRVILKSPDETSLIKN